MLPPLGLDHARFIVKLRDRFEMKRPAVTIIYCTALFRLIVLRAYFLAFLMGRVYWHHMESQTTLRSPRPPSSWESPLCSRRSIRPHPVGVSSAKDLQLLGLLPGLVVPDSVGSTICQQQASAAERSSASLLR